MKITIFVVTGDHLACPSRGERRLLYQAGINAPLAIAWPKEHKSYGRKSLISVKP